MDLPSESNSFSQNYKRNSKKSSEWDSVTNLMFSHPDQVDPEDHNAFITLVSTLTIFTLSKYAILFSVPYAIKKYGLPMTSMGMLRALAFAYVAIPTIVYFNEKESYIYDAQQILVFKYLTLAKQKENDNPGWFKF